MKKRKIDNDQSIWNSKNSYKHINTDTYNRSTISKKYHQPTQINSKKYFIYIYMYIYTYMYMYIYIYIYIYITCIGVSTASSKTPPLFLDKPPFKSANCQSPPLFRQFPPLYWFFVNPPTKSWIFQWTPKILKFFHP